MKLTVGKFVLFGDSITQMSFDQTFGFAAGAALANDYARKLDVVNRGFSGYNSNHAKILLPAIVEAEGDIKLMTLFFGTNDAALTFQHVAISQYIDNMKYLIDFIKSHDIKLIVIGPGLHDSQLCQHKKGKGIFSNNQRTKAYSDSLKNLCQEQGVPFIDLWRQMQLVCGYTEHDLLQDNFDSLSRFLHDGIHYTGESYEILYSRIKDIIKERYPELNSESLPLNVPNYDELDYENAEGSLTPYFH